MRGITIGLGLIAAAMVGCSSTESLDPDLEKLGRATGPSGSNGIAPPPRMQGPEARDPGERLVHTGEVVETMNVPNYTYLKLRVAPGKEIWAAVPQFEARVGSRLEVAQSLVMTAFTSPSLGRTFDEIVFGTLVSDGAVVDASVGKEPRGEDVALPPGHPPIGDMGTGGK